MSDDTTVSEVPVLVQAQERLHAAVEAERRIRREASQPDNTVPPTAIAQAQQATWGAQEDVDRLRQGRDRLRAALPSARQGLIEARGVVQQVRATFKRELARAQKQEAEAVAYYQQIVDNLQQIVGPDAAPEEA